MKRAGYRPYQRQRSCEQTHPMSGRGTHQACFIYHVINLVAVIADGKATMYRLSLDCKCNPNSFLPPLVYNTLIE